MLELYSAQNLTRKPAQQNSAQAKPTSGDAGNEVGADLPPPGAGATLDSKQQFAEIKTPTSGLFAPTFFRKARRARIEERPLGATEATTEVEATVVVTESNAATAENHPQFPTKISPAFRQYLVTYQQDYARRRQHIERGLEVDDLALTVGKAYEKVRKVIDWKEENALRRGAIYRALKRHFLGQIYGVGPQTSAEIDLEQISETMLLELMRTGYFDNELIGQKELDQLRLILHKYIKIIALKPVNPQEKKEQKSRADKRDFKQKMKFQTWVIEVAACEIEECLAPAYKAEAMLELMQTVMEERMVMVPENVLTPEEERLQIALADRRSLYRADWPALTYHLVKLQFPFWLENERAEAVDRVVAEVNQIYELTQAELQNKFGPAFLDVTDHYDAAYRVLEAVVEQIEENLAPEEKARLVSDSDWLGKKLREVYEEKRKSLKGRLLRSAVWSTLSILAANGASIVLLEGPIAWLMGYEFTWLSIVADLLLPSVIMFLLVIIIRLPPDYNYNLVVDEVKKIVYRSGGEDGSDVGAEGSENGRRGSGGGSGGGGGQDTYQVKLKKRQQPLVVKWFFRGMYVICAGLALYAIYWALSYFGLPPTSVYLNVVYITMVFFAATAIKEKSREITLVEKGNFAEFIFDLFSVPLARIGSWFSKKWKEYNVVAILFSALVDTPFSALIGMISAWRDYLKERAAELK